MRAPPAQDEARAVMLTRRREVQEAVRRNEWEKQERDAILERRMRQGDMLSLHREAMRRMQSVANRGA